MTILTVPPPFVSRCHSIQVYTIAICHSHVPDLYRVPDSHLVCSIWPAISTYSVWAFAQSHGSILHDPVRRMDDGHLVRVHARIALDPETLRLPSSTRVPAQDDPRPFHLVNPNMAPVCPYCPDHVRQAAHPMNAARRDSMCWFRLRKDRPYSDNLVSDAGRRLRK